MHNDGEYYNSNVENSNNGTKNIKEYFKNSRLFSGLLLNFEENDDNNNSNFINTYNLIKSNDDKNDIYICVILNNNKNILLKPPLIALCNGAKNYNDKTYNNIIKINISNSSITSDKYLSGISIMYSSDYQTYKALNYSPVFNSRIHNYTTTNLTNDTYYFKIKMTYESKYNSEYSNNHIYATASTQDYYNFEKYLPNDNNNYTNTDTDQNSEKLQIELNNNSKYIVVKHSHNGDYIFTINSTTMT